MKAEMGGTCSTHGRNEKYAHYFGWKHERKRTLGRPRRRWGDNIRIHLRKVG